MIDRLVSTDSSQRLSAAAAVVVYSGSDDNDASLPRFEEPTSVECTADA